MTALVIVLFVAAGLLSFAAGRFDTRNGTFDGPGDACLAIASTLFGAAFLLIGWWPPAVVAAAAAAWCGWDWWHWWNRRRRKRAAALLGAKSRALRDALVRKARKAARPRPVLRPVPQGGAA